LARFDLESLRHGGDAIDAGSVGIRRKEFEIQASRDQTSDHETVRPTRLSRRRRELSRRIASRGAYLATAKL
jgi:hypothetical protein